MVQYTIEVVMAHLHDMYFDSDPAKKPQATQFLEGFQKSVCNTRIRRIHGKHICVS
jgi:hypothetical protein